MEDRSDIEKGIESIDRLVQDSPTLLPECFMYIVHRGLREVKPEAYEPVLVSIGPYHYQNPKLKAMTEHKLRYLHSLLERTKEESVKRYYLELAELEESARKCYVQPTDHPMSKDEFVKMMLLDGCFIIEYFHKIDSLWSANLEGDRIKVDSIVKDDPILQVNWMVPQICVDFLLLENQIPYFVLSKLYGLTLVTNGNDQVAPSLRELATAVFEYALPKPRHNFISDNGGENSTRNFKHLLHLVHTLCTPAPAPAPALSLVPVPASAPAPAPAPTSQERIPKRSIDTHDVVCPLLEAGNTKNDSEEHSDSSKKKDEKVPLFEQMRSAVELQEAGVKFKEAGEVNRTDTTASASLFDITFCNSRMGIPRFQVNDFTETMFRNFIAFEQHYFDVQPKYFTDFASFLDKLINSEKDVKLLRLEGIIVNLLGDDEKVSGIFNKLSDGVLFSPPDVFYYSQQCEELDKHCKRLWNRWMETLWSNYFHTPWAGVSTFAAFVLLVLTLIQTVAALMS